jgi:hypothetical protein
MTPRHTAIGLFAFFTLLFGSLFVAKGVASAPKQDSRVIETQTVSGKITAVQSDTFTIELAPTKQPGTEFRQDEHTTSMTFHLNGSTKVDGNLEVGANADVLYRREGGNNVAVSIRVTAVS